MPDTKNHPDHVDVSTISSQTSINSQSTAMPLSPGAERPPLSPTISSSAPNPNATTNALRQPVITRTLSHKSSTAKNIRPAPLPPNHNLINLQHHSSGSASHHRYVILREKKAGSNVNSPALSPVATNIGPGQQQNSGLGLSVLTSPQLTPSTSNNNLAVGAQGTLGSAKPRPFLRKQASSKYIFSVDDQEDEIEDDLNREYLEGYNDALRHRFKKAVSNVPSALNSAPIGEDSLNSSAGLVPTFSSTTGSAPVGGKVSELESQIANNLMAASNELDTLRETQEDAIHNQSIDYEAGDNDDDDESSSTIREVVVTNANDLDSVHQPQQQHHHHQQQQQQGDGDIPDDASIDSMESFTLRERQDAINETHPFGIRIWKPAIYKKNRSVEIEAENDIHSTPQSARQITGSVLLFNFLWSCTFGLFLLIVCYILGAITSLISVFTNPKRDESLRYAKLYFNLGNYFFIPFGKIVLLKTDKHYIGEDANVGSSLSEFRRWRSQESSKLFFSAPLNNNKPSHNENTPLTGSQQQSDQYSYTTPNDDAEEEGESAYDDEENAGSYKQRLFGRGQWNIGRFVFYLFFYLIVQPLTVIISVIQWLFVFTIPMSKTLFIINGHIRRHPLALKFEVEKDYYLKRLNSNPITESILICTYRSFGVHYYKYTVDGTNIFFINLLFLVIFTIFDFFVLKEYLELDTLITDSSLIFFMCLVSIIPLAYFIGQAVASISAQTSMGVGAVINAFFSTIVEIFLYCIALEQSKGKLVEGSMIGSVLGGVLLLPGTSMCGGAIKRKTQRYNPASAGVSSTMLMYSMLAMMSPTILYEIYGQYEVQCFKCSPEDGGSDCRKCHFFQPSIVVDKLYLNYLKPFTIICAIGLFLAYTIGLLFTLKTHAALIWSTPVAADKEKRDITMNTPVIEDQSIRSLSLDAQRRPQLRPSISIHSGHHLSVPSGPSHQASVIHDDAAGGGGGGHDAPNWSRTKSTTILLSATLLYAVIAEILVDVVDDVLSEFPIHPKFLGLTVFALVPSTTEFVNAISFAMHGNVALSMEIGSAYALQVCLLQIPVVVLYSCWKNGNIKHANIENMFTLIFPRWDFFATLIAVYMFTYIYAEGKSNYFKGSILILLYIVILAGSYFAIEIDSNGLSMMKNWVSANGWDLVAPK